MGVGAVAGCRFGARGARCLHPAQGPRPVTSFGWLGQLARCRVVELPAGHRQDGSGASASCLFVSAA
eukprot:10281301-Lingulodinium_polyedra.AAC.1